MDHKEMYCLIRYWDCYVKEDFFDENCFIIKIHQLIFWLFGKGYLKQKQFNYWINKAEEHQYQVCYSDVFHDYRNPMSVFPECLDEENEYLEYIRMVYVISELLCSLDIYINRTEEIFKKHNIEFRVPDDSIKDFEDEFEEYKTIVNN